MNTLFFVDYESLANLKVKQSHAIEKCIGLNNDRGEWYAAHPNIVFWDYKESMLNHVLGKQYIEFTFACSPQGFGVIDAIFSRLNVEHDKQDLELCIVQGWIDRNIPCWNVSFVSRHGLALAKLNATWELIMRNELPAWHPLIKKGNVNHG